MSKTDIRIQLKNNYSRLKFFSKYSEPSGCQRRAQWQNQPYYRPEAGEADVQSLPQLT